MDVQELKRKAAAFLALHEAPRLLILPCAWDSVSAMLFEKEGCQAIGTTSAGVSSTLGYSDGQRMRLEENMAVVRRIVRQTNLPVSADIEAGYARTTEGVVRSARAVLEAGAVGLNLEDSTGDSSNPLFEVPVMTDRITAIREMASSQGVHLVINLRTDVFLCSEVTGVSRLEEAVERGNAYRNAGADCVFVPDMGDLDKDTISALVDALEAPLNIIAGENTPPVAELEEMGVSRLSFGPRPMRAALALVRKIAREALVQGTYKLMTKDALSYAEVNAWFDRGPTNEFGGTGEDER
jgi:2-methylisocitrate lyase-like PEP mutase family enzyme